VEEAPSPFGLLWISASLIDSLVATRHDAWNASEDIDAMTLKKTILCGLCIIICVVAKTVLRCLGRFLVPRSSTAADVLILEGTDTIERRMLCQATQQIGSERAPRLLLAMHAIPGRPDVEAAHDTAARRMADQCGLGRPLQILRTPPTHPITLTEASVVLQALAGEGIRSAILMTHGFHARRSYLVYKQIGTALGISIMPLGVFVAYTADHWWLSRLGLYECGEERAKTAY
jgi:hypothetical protein